MSDNPNPITWKIHTTHPEKVELLRAAFAEVIDPEIGLNIIQLGLIREVEIDEQATRVRMILTTPFCPYGPAMIETTRQKAQAALDHPAIVEMGPEVWDFAMMEDPGAFDWGMYT